MAIEDLREIGNVLYRVGSDGVMYPVRRLRPDVAPERVTPTAPGLLSGTGIDERAGQINQFLNPIEAIGGSMDASRRMVAPNATGWDRMQALGDMLSGVAGVAAPMSMAARSGAPAATALMEGLLGWSPTREAVGDTARAVGRDVVDRLNQRGPMPTTYSNPIPGLLGGADEAGSLPGMVRGRPSLDVSRHDASNIFGAGSERVRYTDPQSGGTIEVVVRPDGSASVLELEVPEASRGQGIGQALQERVMQDFPIMGGQVSSKAAATTAYRLGRRPPGKPAATLEEVFADIDEMSSVNMVSPAMQERFAPVMPSLPSLPTPRNDAEAMARDILQLRAEGRAADVTEEMMAAADPQYMYANTPLPMDAASRMARADEMGFDPSLHGTGADISAVDPTFFGSGKDVLGSGFYTTTNANRANIYAPKATSHSIEVSKQFAEGSNIMPLSVRMDAPFDLAQQTGAASGEIGRAAAVDPYYTHDPRLSGDFISGQGGESAFLDPYHPRFQTLQRLRAGFGPQTTSDFLSEAGYSGVVGPEAGGNLVRVSYRPEDIRSRFARFDPEFAHLRNLSAAMAAGLPLGLLAMQPDQEQY